MQVIVEVEMVAVLHLYYNVSSLAVQDDTELNNFFLWETRQCELKASHSHLRTICLPTFCIF